MTQALRRGDGPRRRVASTCARGEVLALLGDNGAGKSTLIKAISGVAASRLGDGSPSTVTTSPTPTPPPPGRAGSRPCTRTWRCSTIWHRPRTSSLDANWPGRSWLPRAVPVAARRAHVGSNTRARRPAADHAARLRSAGRVDVGRPTPSSRGRPRRRLLIEAGHPRRADRRPRTARVGDGCSTSSGASSTTASR